MSYEEVRKRLGRDGFGEKEVDEVLHDIRLSNSSCQGQCLPIPANDEETYSQAKARLVAYREGEKLKDKILEEHREGHKKEEEIQNIMYR